MDYSDQPEEATFTNPTDALIALHVGQGPRTSDRIYRCEPGGIMKGPKNYKAFFERNGLVEVPGDAPAVTEVAPAPSSRKRGQ